ncbi:TolC family outer membrane protein [Phenylobacterium conjunctum]|jgi:outer membrane protein|uniref:TolC family outer membrane protein n=1 Tax=Phenylobacterium conjunctum TaxID=1298959 RepID=A0ABW3SYR8_9CAUL
MLISRRGGLLAAVSGAAALVAGSASAETLADAIALAYQTNPTLQAQRATLRQLDESWVQARAGYRPTLTATAQGNYEQTRINGRTTLADTNGDGVKEVVSNAITETNSATGALTFSQPIWTGGRVGAAVSAAEADILAGRENLRRTEATVLGTVIQAYVDVRRDQEALHIRENNVAVLTRQLEESKARFDVGEITRTDVAQSEARLAAAQAQLQSSQAQLAISRAAYAAVVGQNPGDLAPEPSLASLLPNDPDAAFDLAEKNNPQIRAAEYAEQASRARLASARAERMPTVSVQAKMAWVGAGDPFDTDRMYRDVTGAAAVTVPLFNGGLTTSRVRAAIERNNADRLSVESAKRSVLQNLTNAWSTLLSTRANISSTDVQVKAARIAAEGTRQEQQVGLRTTIDVLNAEQELRSAELSQVTARHDEYIAAANLLSQMGRLEAAYLVPNAPRYDPKANFGKLRITWGWTPWEEPIAIVDGVLTPKTKELPREQPPAAAK